MVSEPRMIMRGVLLELKKVYGGRGEMPIDHAFEEPSQLVRLSDNVIARIRPSTMYDPEARQY
jgi:hypothetical protein